MNVYLTRPYVFLKQGPASSPSSTFWNVEALHSPPPSMNDSQRMSGGQRCPDPRPLKNTGAGPGDTSEARLRCWVTSWFPDSSRCAQITVLSTSLAVALFVRPVGPALYLLHFSKNAAYAQPSLVLRLLCLPHPPGAQAQVLLGLAWGSGPALPVVGTAALSPARPPASTPAPQGMLPAPLSPARPPASTPAPQGMLPTPRPPHTVARHLPYFLHSTGNCLIQLFTMLLSEYLQDANSRRVSLLSVPDIAQVAQGSNTW